MLKKHESYLNSKADTNVLIEQHLTRTTIECLHSEIPPTAPRLPILVIHIRSKIKRRQSQRYKF